MSNHKTGIERTDTGWWAHCSCREAMTRSSPHRWVAEDWDREHMAQVERAKAGLHRDTATRANTLKHYAAMMEDPSVPATERMAWKQLHDELSRRPARVTPAAPHLPGPDDVALFEVE